VDKHCLYFCFLRTVDNSFIITQSKYFDNDLKNADILIKNNGIIIIDDINIDYINDAVNYYINNNNYVELLFLELKINIHPHRIIKKK
jgi:hypothetical protein